LDTGFVSVLEQKYGEAYYDLGLVEIAVINLWTRDGEI
jgi:hypothetical protein